MHTEGIIRHHRSVLSLWRGLLVSVLALALLLVGFGHRSLQAEPQATAYLLAGGDWADLCGDTDAPHLTGDRCMACLLAQGMMLPDPSSSLHMSMQAGIAPWTAGATTLRAVSARLSHPPRAPPAADRSTFI
jgi:hypothetical protein